MSHSFSSDQWEDDIIILLTLKSVNCCHLHQDINTLAMLKPEMHYYSLEKVFSQMLKNASCLVYCYTSIYLSLHTTFLRKDQAVVYTQIQDLTISLGRQICGAKRYIMHS